MHQQHEKTSLIHGFSPVNALFLTVYGTAFYAITHHKNCMTTCVMTLWRLDVKSFTTTMSTMCFFFEIMIILKAIKSHLKGSYEKWKVRFMNFI